VTDFLVTFSKLVVRSVWTRMGTPATTAGVGTRVGGGGAAP
jgi:hypothetical protein